MIDVGSECSSWVLYLKSWMRLSNRTSRARMPILGEYTAHYNRQKIDDEFLREARVGGIARAGAEKSLANAVYLDRLDRVKLVPGGTVKMAKL